MLFNVGVVLGLMKLFDVVLSGEVHVKTVYNRDSKGRCLSGVKRKWKDPREFFGCPYSRLSNTACGVQGRKLCCKRLAACRHDNWCNGGQPVCPNRHSGPMCTGCPPGYQGDRCLDPFPTVCTCTENLRVYDMPLCTSDTFEKGLNCIAANNSHFECVYLHKTAIDEENIDELEDCRIYIKKLQVLVGMRQTTGDRQSSGVYGPGETDKQRYDEDSNRTQKKDDKQDSGAASVATPFILLVAVVFIICFQ